jgi:glycosyltransferase involved in cell wall biosynthesis
MRRLEADVAHGYLFDAEIAVRLAGRLSGTPLIVGSERNTDYSLKRVQLLAYRLTRGHVDMIVANSNAGAAFNSRLLGHSLERYRVVHNGVDTRRFAPRDRLEARQRLRMAAGVPVVGMVASFKEQKNHPLLFAAAQRVIARRPDVQLLLVGEELHAGMHGSREYRGRMDLLVDKLGLRPHCTFFGNQDDVESIYPACDVTVLPSLFEGTPNVALESMACAVPVVATDVADNAAIVPDGRVGFIVPLGDERALADRLARLLTDTDLRMAMSSAARRWVEREFSTQRLADKTESVYREWLTRGGRRPVS